MGEDEGRLSQRIELKPAAYGINVQLVLIELRSILVVPVLAGIAGA